MSNSFSKKRHIKDANKKLEKRFIFESKEKLYEGLGMTLLILTGLGLFYLTKNIKQFISKFKNSDSYFYLKDFFMDLHLIEKGSVDGKIIIKKNNHDYKIIIEIEGNEKSSIFVDTLENKIYKDESKNILILPEESFGDETTDKQLRLVQNHFIDRIIKIIGEYSKKIN